MHLMPTKVRDRDWKDSKRLGVAASPAKRPRSQTSLQASLQDSHSRKKVKKRKKAKPAMPTLQSLPQEILEMIFLYSMNISLPHASPLLGRQLSSRHVTLEFTMKAFFHTVDHKSNIRTRTVTSNSQLQSSILSCRFFTYYFFLAYVQRAHDAMVKLRGKAWEKTGVPVLGVHEFDELFVFKFTKIPYLSFAPVFYIPEKLLHGPFTKDKASLLYVLVALSGQIDWMGSTAGETAKSGIKEAIREGNEYAVASLAVVLGVAKAITTKMIRYAVMDCGCRINILRHLLFNAQILGRSTPKEILDFHDRKLWTWAAEHPKGDILMDMLKRADRFDLEFYFEEDADWKTIVGFPYGGSKFDPRTALGNVVRELLTNLYENHGRKITRGRQIAM